MKFATYIQDKESNSRFGFKKDNYIIDISSAAQWANKTKNNSRFLEIPASLKEALGSWDINFSKLQQLDAFLEENNFDPKSNNFHSNPSNLFFCETSWLHHRFDRHSDPM